MNSEQWLLRTIWGKMSHSFALPLINSFRHMHFLDFFFFSSQKKEHGKYKKILEIFPYSKIWKEDFWGNEKILKWKIFKIKTS